MSTITSIRQRETQTGHLIVRCLEATEEQDDIRSSVEVVVFDVPAILKHAAAIKFHEYAQDVFVPHVERQQGKAHKQVTLCGTTTEQNI